jgi:hypothetical protein
MSLPKYEAYKDSGASWELGRRSAAEGVPTLRVGTMAMACTDRSKQMIEELSALIPNWPIH